MTLTPVVVSPLVYVLKLKDNKVYVGITMNFNLRYAQHLAGEGANWTRLHKPIEVMEIIPNAYEGLEKAKTLECMNEHGWDNVRGGPWCQVTYKTDPR
jgi:predicted GIY-YIG superfamily endonuclease